MRNKTISISEENFDLLQKEVNASELVNDLLDVHYSTQQNKLVLNNSSVQHCPSCAGQMLNWKNRFICNYCNLEIELNERFINGKIE